MVALTNLENSTVTEALIGGRGQTPTCTILIGSHRAFDGPSKSAFIVYEKTSTTATENLRVHGTGTLAENREVNNIYLFVIRSHEIGKKNRT